jgi:hypothetical protein
MPSVAVPAGGVVLTKMRSSTNSTSGVPQALAGQNFDHGNRY